MSTALRTEVPASLLDVPAPVFDVTAPLVPALFVTQALDPLRVGTNKIKGQDASPKMSRCQTVQKKYDRTNIICTQFTH